MGNKALSFKFKISGSSIFSKSKSITFFPISKSKPATTSSFLILHFFSKTLFIKFNTPLPITVNKTNIIRTFILLAPKSSSIIYFGIIIFKKGTAAANKDEKNNVGI